jgi:hypothetical protein
VGELVDQRLLGAHLGHQTGSELPKLVRVEVVKVRRCIHASQFARTGASTESKLFTSLCALRYTTVIA